MSRPTAPGAASRPSLVVPVTLGIAVAAGACSLLPGGASSTPETGESCAVRVENRVAWGLTVSLDAPDGREPRVFQREISYLERDAGRVLEVPCTYGSALVTGRVRRVSGLSGMQRTRFRTGICLTPGDTAVAVLDEYGEWDERWWEDCPAVAEADSAGAPAELAAPPA